MAYYAYDKNIGKPVYLPTADDFTDPLPHVKIANLLTENLVVSGNVNISGATSVTLPRIAYAIDGLQSVIDRTNSLSGTNTAQNADIVTVSGRNTTSVSGLTTVIPATIAAATVSGESTLAKYINKPGYVGGDCYRLHWGDSLTGQESATADGYFTGGVRGYGMIEYLSYTNGQPLLIPSKASTLVRKIMGFLGSSTGVVTSAIYTSPTDVLLTLSAATGTGLSNTTAIAIVRGISGINGVYYDPNFSLNASGAALTVTVTNAPTNTSGTVLPVTATSKVDVGLFDVVRSSTRYFDGIFGWGGSTSWDVYQYKDILASTFRNAYPTSNAIVFLRIFENDMSLGPAGTNSRVFTLLQEDGFTPATDAPIDITIASAKRWITFVQSQGMVPCLLTPVISAQYSLTSKQSFYTICNALFSLKKDFPGTIVLDYNPSIIERISNNLYSQNGYKPLPGTVPIASARSNVVRTVGTSVTNVITNATNGIGTVNFSSSGDISPFIPGNIIYFDGFTNNSTVTPFAAPGALFKAGGFQNACTILSVSGTSLLFFHPNTGNYATGTFTGGNVSTVSNTITITTAAPHTFSTTTPVLVRFGNNGSFAAVNGTSPIVQTGAAWTFDTATVPGRFTVSGAHTFTTGMVVTTASGAGTLPNTLSGTTLQFSSGITVTSPTSWFYNTGLTTGTPTSGTANATWATGNSSSTNSVSANGIYYPIAVGSNTVTILAAVAVNISGGDQPIGSVTGTLFPGDEMPNTITADGIHPSPGENGERLSGDYLSRALKESKLLFPTNGMTLKGPDDANTHALNPFLIGAGGVINGPNSNVQLSSPITAAMPNILSFPFGGSFSSTNLGLGIFNLVGSGYVPYKNSTMYKLVINGLAGRAFPTITNSDNNATGFGSNALQPNMTFSMPHKSASTFAGFRTVSGSGVVTLYFSDATLASHISAATAGSGFFIANSGDSFVDGPIAPGTAVTVATTGTTTPTGVSVSGQDVTWLVPSTSMFTVNNVVRVAGFTTSTGAAIGLNGFGICNTITTNTSVVITMDSAYGTPVAPTGTAVFGNVSFATTTATFTRPGGATASSTKNLSMSAGRISAGGPTNLTNGFHVLGGNISGGVVTLKLAPTSFSGTSPMANWAPSGTTSGTTSIWVTTTAVASAVRNTQIEGYFPSATWDSVANTITYTPTVAPTGTLVPPGTYVTRAIPVGSPVSFTGGAFTAAAGTVPAFHTVTVNTRDIINWRAAPYALTPSGGTTTVLTAGIGVVSGGNTSTITGNSSISLGSTGAIQLLNFPDNSNVQVVFDGDVISSTNLRNLTPQCRDSSVTGSTTNNLAAPSVAGNGRGMKNLLDGKTYTVVGKVSTISLLEFPWVANTIRPFFSIQFGATLGLNTPFAATIMLRYLNVLLS